MLTLSKKMGHSMDDEKSHSHGKIMGIIAKKKVPIK